MRNRLFDRLRLQAQLRLIFNQWGAEQGLVLILLALEKELEQEHTNSITKETK